MFVVCDICQVNISTAQEYDKHMSGRRHQVRLKNYEERKHQSSCSIFVKGYPPGTKEAELENYFSYFGKVKKVVFDKQQNKVQGKAYAIIEYEAPNSTQIALSYKPHILNSEHLIVRARDFKVLETTPYFPWQKQQKHEQLPWGNYEEPVQRQGNFGGPRQGNFGGPPQGNFGGPPQGNFGGPRQGNFGGPREGNFGGPPQGNFGGPPGQDNYGASQQPGMDYDMGFGDQGYMSFYGEGEEMTPEQIAKYQKEMKKQQAQKLQKERAKKEEEEQLPIAMDELDHYFGQHKVVGVSRQMTSLIELLQVTPEELQSRYTICKTLEDALSPFFPGVAINQFGSSVNGFGIQGCDMDVYLDLSKMGIPCRSAKIQLPYHRDIRSVRKQSGPFNQEDVDHMSNYDKVKLISRILVEHAPSCRNTLTIPSNRCPLIRFQHEISKIKCDLSVNNKLALQNTRLLQTYSLFDQRIKPLIYAVRYWAKIKGLAGNPKAGNQLSNYALTWMVLYYLMNTQPSLVPTVEYLASLCGNDRTWIDCWDCSFVAAQMIPPSTNKQTAEELLYGFFAFYGSFDFRASCISTRTGLIMPVAKMVLDKTMKIGVVNVQDPFVLNHNITVNVNEKMANKITQEMKIAEAKAKIWFAIDNPPETKSLIDIFNEIIPPGLNLEEEKKSVDASGYVLGKYQFLIPMKTQNMTPIKLKELEDDGDIYSAWCKRMIKFVHGILERVLMFDCEIRTTSLPHGYLPKTRSYSHKKKTATTPGVKRGPDTDAEANDAKRSKTENEKDPAPSASKDGPQTTSKDSPDATSKDMPQAMDQSSSEDKGENVDPFLAEMDFSNVDTYVDMDVLCFLRIWGERKKIGNKLKERGFQESLELEQTISETLYYDYYKPSVYPILEFRLIIKSDNKPGMASSLIVEAIEKPRQREYDAVYHYIKKFILKAVEKWF